MSEMLANHYFMIRNFTNAIELYERVVEKNGPTKSIQKKMIICYVKTNQIDKAAEEFSKLVENDVGFIINTDLVNDDCPCSELIYELENDFINLSSSERELALGIIWLYCDKNKSVEFLKEYLSKKPNDFRIAKSLQIIKNYNANSN